MTYNEFYDKVKYGTKVRILSGNHTGKAAWIEAPSQGNFAVIIPGIQAYFYYSYEELEIIEESPPKKSLECPCGIVRKDCDYHK